MKVFLVIEDFGYEGDEVNSVYSNRRAAKQKKAELEADDITWTIRIDEMELLDA